MPFQLGEDVRIKRQGNRRWLVVKHVPEEDGYQIYNSAEGGSFMVMPEEALEIYPPLPPLGSRIWMGANEVMGVVVEHKLPNSVLVRVTRPTLVEYTGDELEQFYEVSDEHDGGEVPSIDAGNLQRDDGGGSSTEVEDDSDDGG